MARASELADAFDHPITFTLVVAVVVVAWLAIITWIAKAADIPGLAALAQHP